jgi:flagellar basal body-associated protein FliL
MDWLGISLLILIIMLLIGLGILVVCMLSNQGCTVSIQKRSTNPELTKMKQEEMNKQQNKFSSKVKRAFKSSSKDEQPPEAVEDVKSVEFTFKLADNNKDSEKITTVDESLTVPLQPARESPAEREARRKRHDEIKRKYNL